jgi:adenylate cyclase
LQSENASDDADGREFCREWEAVYVAIRNGRLAAAETKLDLFLAKYPEDGVARYHRSIRDDAAGMSRSSDQKSKATLPGRERG